MERSGHTKLFVDNFLTNIFSFYYFYISKTYLEGNSNVYFRIKKVVLKNAIMNSFKPSTNLS